MLSRSVSLTSRPWPNKLTIVTAIVAKKIHFGNKTYLKQDIPLGMLKP